jgi:hypothetical protein
MGGLDFVLFSGGDILTTSNLFFGLFFEKVVCFQK